ncbi:hypothetical protein [Flavobacterium crocinum]|nr:hypothetical protein [Flavobacterium crocinum]
MDEDPKTIMTGFTPLDFLVTLVMPSISESIIESWDRPVYELAEKAKDKGIRGINDFLLTSSGQQSRYGFNILEINQIVLNKLLRGEIKTIDQLRDLKNKNKQNEFSMMYTLFYSSVYNQDEDKYITTIDSIFINN